jgi:hypothetical protein
MYKRAYFKTSQLEIMQINYHFKSIITVFMIMTHTQVMSIIIMDFYFKLIVCLSL